MELGYARVSATSQDVARQYDTLHQHGLSDERIWSDKQTGADTDRPGLAALLAYACEGDVIVAGNLDRIGRNLRDCLHFVHDLRERGIGIRTLNDPLPLDTADDSVMGQVAVAMLSLFAEIERVFASERAAHARAARRAGVHPVGRKRKLPPDQDAALAVAGGMSLRAAARAHGVGHVTLHRALQAQQQDDTEGRPGHRQHCRRPRPSYRPALPRPVVLEPGHVRCAPVSGSRSTRWHSNAAGPAATRWSPRPR